MADKQVSWLTSSTPTIDDLTISYDNADTSELKKTTWQLVRDLFKTYFDTIYQAVLVSWTNIKTINSTSILGSGDIVISGGGSVATDAIWDSKWDLAGGTGANTASRLAVGTNWQVLTADSAEVTGLKWSNPAGGWDALTSGTLAQFAATTSLELKWVISDETGSGSLVFATSPTLVTPVLGVATATSINGATITSGTLNWSVTWTNTGDQTSIVGITGTKAQFDTAVTDWNIVYSGDSPTLGTITTTGNIELGNASDTTISRVSAGVIAVEGVNLGNEGILQNSQSAAYTLVLTDAGKHIYHPSADTTARIWTIPANSSVAYPIGTAITFINDTSAGTITISITSDTLVLAGAGTTGSRTLTANWVATAVKMTSTRWMISGSSNLS